MVASGHDYWIKFMTVNLYSNFVTGKAVLKINLQMVWATATSVKKAIEFNKVSNPSPVCFSAH
jgi:hypothetical protein